MCRVCYGPSLSCAEFAMCRVVPKSSRLIYGLLCVGVQTDEAYSTWVAHHCFVGQFFYRFIPCLDIPLNKT